MYSWFQDPAIGNKESKYGQWPKSARPNYIAIALNPDWATHPFYGGQCVRVCVCVCVRACVRVCVQLYSEFETVAKYAKGNPVSSVNQYMLSLYSYLYNKSHLTTIQLDAYTLQNKFIRIVT